MNIEKLKIGIIGLGYVGLPIAVEFGKKVPTVGFDINEKRIKSLASGKDYILEVPEEELQHASKLRYTNQRVRRM
nr:hypothetical protein [Pasteurella multocida]